MRVVEERNIKEYINNYPATSTIIFITILLHLLTYMLGDGATDYETARRFGALYSANKDWSEFPYLLTSTYQHIGGSIHIMLNISFIIICAPFLEELYGTLKFVLLYNLTGIAGGLVTLIFETNVISSGASAAGYGMLGIYIALIVKQHPQLSSVNRQSIISMLIIGIIMTFTVPNISITGHLGGLIAGALLGMFLSTKHVTKGNTIASIIKTLVVMFLLLVGLNIPKKVITTQSFSDVINKIGLEVNNRSPFLSSFHGVNDEVKWISNYYNNYFYKSSNTLLQAYNAGISGNATSALETVETTIQEIKRQVAEVQSHTGIVETQNVQQELLTLYQSLEKLAYTLREGLTTMDYYILNQYVLGNNSLVESSESFLNNLQSLY
ncbi:MULTISPECIES: rhomboid family intramembrane serine protease [Lysinibacillus]|uniref:rhomboid family intramembrane serine protease n=1 Tax=Lysinibacillus TaxID=400634 RepID=UPI002DB87403|nr:rhomboid family intramembrane serine protease [Lysinibacillus sphaericus]MEB7454366.1 rhomboid family intramembrane serine protease [Lysinibacillus sphaericus]WKT76889.1 rhomboid family intramembrane serine protease [Lysinibacillus fusiformis]